MQSDTPLDDSRIDPLRATQLMKLAGFSMDTFGNPQDGAKLNDVLKYFADKEDAEYVINKFKMQTRGEGILDHAYRFVKLRQQKDNMIAELRNVDKELSLYD